MQTRRSVFLIAAFAALLGVSALAAWSVLRNAREAQGRSAALHRRELAVNEALEAIRGRVYLTAILTRDYLLDPDPADVKEHVSQVEAMRAETRASFETLSDAASGDVPEETTLSRLKTEVNDYWDSNLAILTMNPINSHPVAALQQRMNRRAEIFALASRIEQLTEQNSAREKDRIANADREFRSSLAWITGGALLLGLGISVFALRHMRKLELQSQIAESELRMLSVELRNAQEQERKFLSRELHDQVGQMLTGLRMELTALSRTQAAPESPTTMGLARAKGTVEQALGMVRNIAMLLRPSMLDDLGLTPALLWLAKEMSRASGMDIRAHVDPKVDGLPEAHRTCLYRVVQESLTNATRHSGGRTVDLHVAADSRWVTASVRDDGRGFTAGGQKPKGIGLLGMEERVRELGGKLLINTAPGRGTTVEIHLPRPASMEATSDDGTDRGRSRDRQDRLTAAS